MFPDEVFVVLGAGLPRTGTASLRLALNQLLGGKCYHMYEFFEAENCAEQAMFWKRAMAGRASGEVSFILGQRHLNPFK